MRIKDLDKLNLVKFGYGVLDSGPSQFSQLPHLPQKMMFYSKVDQIGPLIIYALHKSKSITHSVDAWFLLTCLVSIFSSTFRCSKPTSFGPKRTVACQPMTDGSSSPSNNSEKNCKFEFIFVVAVVDVGFAIEVHNIIKNISIKVVVAVVISTDGWLSLFIWYCK